MNLLSLSNNISLVYQLYSIVSISIAEIDLSVLVSRHVPIQPSKSLGLAKYSVLLLLKRPLARND